MKSVNWSAYARQYDLMTENNPAYQELVRQYQDFLASCTASNIRRVLDVGAGTGNFSLLAAQCLSSAKVTHLEPDAGMNACARDKARANQLNNLLVDERAIEEAQFPAEHFDLVVSVHALYTMQKPQEQLRRFAAWLRPGGQAFLCDFGRTMDVADWRGYLFQHLRRKFGALGALKLFWRGREVARQNWNVAALQKCGQYWLHTTEEFQTAVEAAGFQIIRQELVYRGYSDLVIAKRI